MNSLSNIVHFNSERLKSLFDIGADEPVHHVHVRQHHLDLPYHDGYHDDGQVRVFRGFWPETQPSSRNTY